MATTKITRESLYALKVKFDTEQEQKRLGALRMKEEQMVKSALDNMVKAATTGADNFIVEFSNEDSELALLVVRGIRKEIPDICLNVHEYFPKHPDEIVSRIKSISMSWAPGSGRGYLG